YGSSYRSPETFLVIGNKLYVGGEFSTVDWGDGVQHNTANFVSYGLSGTNLTVGETFDGVFSSGVYALAGNSASQIWVGSSSTQLDELNDNNNNVTAHPLSSGFGSAVKLTLASSGILYGAGNISRGHISQYFFSYANGEFSGARLFRGNYTGSAVNWTQESLPAYGFFDMVVYPGAAVTGDGNGNLYALFGNSNNSLRVYDTNTDSWTSQASLSGIDDGAALVWANNALYAFKGGSSTDFCRWTSNSWNCNIADSPYAISSGSAMSWDGRYYIYATPGGNGRQFMRYNIPYDAWEILGDGNSATPTDDDVPTAVNAGGSTALIGNELYAVPGNDVGSLYRYDPVGIYQERLTVDDVAIVVPNSSSSASWTDATIQETFDISTDNATLVGGSSTNWSPDWSSYGIDTTNTDHTNAAFLDSSLDLYRLTAGSVITAGYHTYRSDALVGTSGQEFSSIQQALNSGANQITVMPGVYQEAVALPSGVALVGAGANRTIITPPDNNPPASLVRAEGVVGSEFGRFTVAGGGALDGIIVEDGSSDVTISRNILRDNINGLLLDDSATDAELVNLTVVGNENGITAVNCAPLDIRNIIIAYNSSTGLQFDGSGTCPGSTYLHNYNLYWANGTDMNPLTPGTAEEFLDPLFTDSADQDYRVKDESPIIDAGDPADPTPPGTGNRVDVGYLEQGSAAFYADDDYCDLCANDGLTWGVDAFDVIQDALDAAAADLAALATDDVQYSVGVGAGNYNESVTVSSYIQLVGHSAEDTFILGNGGPGVTFDGVVQAGVSSFDITGQGTPTTSVTITGGANSISITGNILSGSRGVWLGGRSTADISFNTIVSGTTAVYATDASTWANVENNILSNNASGLETDGIAQLFSDYNLLFNNTDYTNVTPGDNDLTGQNPLFETGSLRLQAASPAVDTASPLAIVPTGGGERADMGYRELAATPITLFLGDDGVSTAVAYIGVEDVEYGIVPVTVPTSTVTATIPLTWTAVTLNNPGAALSYWNLDYTPANEQLHRLYTRANDSVNNQESDNTVWYAGAFVVDDTAPQISLLYPPEGGSASGISPVELRAEVSDYAAAEFSVEEIYFEIDGQTVTAAWAAEPWTDDGQSARVFRIWTTLSNGSHTIRAIAEDKAGNISSSASGTFIVTGSSSADTTAPTLAVTSPLDGDFVQQTAVFSGTVSDSGSSVASVEVSVDGGVSWEAAAVNGSNWSLTISFPADSEFVSYPAQVRAADKAGNNTIVYRIITIDNLPPTGLQPVTFSSDPGTYFSGPTTLTVTWNTPVDGSGVANVLLDSDTLSDTVPSSGVSGNSAVINLNANDDWYVHIGAVDAADNLNFYNFGPWYVGAGINIDGYLDLAHNEWRSNERLDENENCLSNGLFDTQTLYTTWDNNAVYLGWQNAWWDLDGTMWAYLDTAVGGSSTAMNGDPLPFAADYAMMVTGTDAAEGLLWAYNGTNWTSSALTFAQGQTGDTEAKLPITVSGIATLRLLAFAEDDANTAWTVFPTTNYPQPTWPDYYEWIDPSTIGNVNAGQPQAPCINMSLTSPQPTHVTQGPNDSLSYIMTLPNAESDLVSGLEIALTTDSHLTLQSVTGATCSANCGSGQNWILSVPDLAPTATHFITLTGQLAADLTSITAVTGTADLSWNNTFVHAGSFSHHIDGDKPVVDIYIPPGFAIAGGSQQIYGWADDGPGSGIAQVEIRQDGTDPWLTATGSNLWSATITPPTQSSTWQIEARATDWQGHVSDVVTVNFFVDSVPPVITPTIPLSVKGTYASLTGLAFDPYPVNSLVTAVTVQLDSSAANWNAANVYTPKTDGSQSWAYAWQLPQEDGITHTLRISATDQVGNFTFTNWQDVVVDTVPPVLTATQQITQVLINNNNPILSGSVTDGYGVAQLTAWVYLPDGTAVQESITFAGTSWDYIPTIPISGTYSLWVIAQDLAGNQTVVGDFSLIVYDLGGVSIADVIVDELSPTAVFTVTLHPTSIEDVIIDYTTADGTAVGSSDYTPISGTLTITAGQNSGFIVVPLLDDAVDEAAETFTVTLISLQNSSLSDGQGIGTIVDDDHTPISLGDVYTATEDIPLNVTLPTLLDNDIDQDGDPITATLDSQPLSGTLVLNAAGTFVYTPTLNFYGIDSFTYRATDGFNYSPPVTVTLNVTPVNDPPIAVDDTVFTYAGVAVTTDVLANDINVDGNLDTFFVESISQPVSGTAQINLDATVTYSPAAEFDGQDYFRYVVSDGVYTDTAVITITVAQNIIFLPVIQNTNAIMTAPDLIVEDIQVTADNVQITITNVGNGDVTSAFWIDLYINPNPAPTAVNQLWNYLGTEGLVWGVIDVSSLTAGGSLVLDMKHPSYRPGNSQFNGFFSVGMEIYVQVDSAAADTDYGGVLESHEIQGDPYNNISHLTVSTLQTLPTSNQTPTSSASDEAVMVHLPLRP
ncbi:MAG: tandem-95 repeat protein, partial [Chloroflexi bacterium]|nr:tandem-95 repeat protein [Chloroflexota bacterium]